MVLSESDQRALQPLFDELEQVTGHRVHRRCTVELSLASLEALRDAMAIVVARDDLTPHGHMLVGCLSLVVEVAESDGAGIGFWGRPPTDAAR